MTPFKDFRTPSSWKRRLRRGGLYMTVAVVLGAQMGCGNGNGGDWEEVTTYQVTKGVVTTLEETQPGQFSIVDEKVVEGKDSSRVIIKRLDGTTETLTLEQARGLVQPQDTVYQTSNYQHHHGMGHVLWWGAMGYMMGRSFNRPVQSYVYRDDERRGGTGGGYYGGGTGFRSGSWASQELRRSAVPRTELRPVKGRSGFFRNTFRGRSGG